VVTTEELKARIEDSIPGAQADVLGDGRHFEARVFAPEFAGMSRIEQHRRVYAVFGSEVGDRIHALSLKTGA
jgi:acid stress-induced BolA-like protein IbaG/YrbA